MAKVPILLDTNLFLLFVVGTYSCDAIEKHKRLNTQSPDSFMLLCLYLEGFHEIIVTPHTVAETSSLLRQVGSPLKDYLGEHFRQVLLRTREAYVPSVSTVTNVEFVRLGVTDCVLLNPSLDADPVVLTVDLDLYLASEAHGREVVNFNHLRAQHGV